MDKPDEDEAAFYAIKPELQKLVADSNDVVTYAEYLLTLSDAQLAQEFELYDRLHRGTFGVEGPMIPGIAARSEKLRDMCTVLAGTRGINLAQTDGPDRTKPN